MLLTAPTPAAFLATHVNDRQARHDEEATGSRAWRSLHDLLEGDARLLRDLHATIVASGEPPKAAVKYLVGWVGGFLAETVGYVFATADAGVLASDRVRWRFHPDGWTDRVDLSGCTLVVTAGHPWSGLEGVDTVADDDTVRAVTVDALVRTLTPLVEAGRALARLGRNAVWCEVADGLGMATACAPALERLGPTIPRLEALLAAPGVPWRTRPTLWQATGRTGPMVIARKGGCCLAYTGIAADGADEEPDEDVDADHRAYRERFPRVPGEPAYCSTCCFREPDEVEARQVFWTDLQEERRT